MNLRWLSGLPKETSAPSIEDVARYSFTYLTRNQEQFQSAAYDGNEEAVYLLDLIREYSSFLQDLGVHGRIEHNARLRDRNPIGQPEEAVNPTTLQNNILRHLRTTVCSEPLTCLSPSHGTTGPLLRACRQINPGMKIGVLCLDAHADLYEVDTPLWKGNVFSHLLYEGTIIFLAVVGIPEFRRANILPTLPPSTTQCCALYTEDVTSNNMQEIAHQMVEAGVTHLFSSFDPDGFDTQHSIYTAMEYCPFTSLINAGTPGVNSLDDILRPLNLYQGQRRNLYRIGAVGIPFLTMAKLVQNLYEALHGHVLPYLDCNIPVLGDVVELSGPDVEGRTATAAMRLANTLENVYTPNRKEPL